MQQGAALMPCLYNNQAMMTSWLFLRYDCNFVANFADGPIRYVAQQYSLLQGRLGRVSDTMLLEQLLFCQVTGHRLPGNSHKKWPALLHSDLDCINMQFGTPAAISAKLTEMHSRLYL